MDEIELSELAIRILFLFLPGIIATYIIDMLTSHRKRKPFNFIVHSYLIGVLSYGTLILSVFIINFIVDWMKNTPTLEVHFLKALLNSNEQIKVGEVFLASLVGFILAIIISKIISKKYLYKVANALGVSDKHGDGDVWEFILGSNDVEWVNLRDRDANLIYQGAVHAFSQKEEKKEIVLSQVKVFKDEKNGEPEEIYEMPFVYLNFDASSNVALEIYETGVGNHDGQENTTKNQS